MICSARNGTHAVSLHPSPENQWETVKENTVRHVQKEITLKFQKKISAVHCGCFSITRIVSWLDPHALHNVTENIILVGQFA